LEFQLNIDVKSLVRKSQDAISRTISQLPVDSLRKLAIDLGIDPACAWDTQSLRLELCREIDQVREF